MADVVTSSWTAEQISAMATKTASTCFLCKWILEDLKLHGKLTGYPKDFNGKDDFPESGKIKHLKLEKSSIENRLTLKN